MTTLGELTHYVRNQLTGLGSITDSVTALREPITASTASIPVEDAGGLGAGQVVEIDTELIRIKTADAQSATLTTYEGFGRGYAGTTAAAHGAGAMVSISPVFPTAMLLQEINGVLTEIYPRIYGVKQVTLGNGYLPLQTLPDDAVGVISVHGVDQIHGHFVQERDWAYNPDLKQLSLRGALRDHNVRIVYATRPKTFAAGDLSQDFTLTTGLDDRVKDIFAMGVAVRLAPMLDVARLPFATAEARDMGDGRASGQGSDTARLLYSMFQQRVDQESAVLAKEHPIKTNRTR